MTRKRISKIVKSPIYIYRRAKKLKRWTQLLVLISFTITFGLIRLVTHLQKRGMIPNQTHGTHIHHLVPGIFLLIITGYIGISYWHKEGVREAMAILYGMGAALTLDEFALWLYLHDVYWERQGRDSIDAIIVTGVVMLIVFIVTEIYDSRRIRQREVTLQEENKNASV